MATKTAATVKADQIAADPDDVADAEAHADMIEQATGEWPYDSGIDALLDHQGPGEWDD